MKNKELQFTTHLETKCGFLDCFDGMEVKGNYNRLARLMREQAYLVQGKKRFTARVRVKPLKQTPENWMMEVRNVDEFILGFPQNARTST